MQSRSRCNSYARRRISSKLGPFATGGCVLSVPDTSWFLSSRPATTFFDFISLASPFEFVPRTCHRTSKHTEERTGHFGFNSPPVVRRNRLRIRHPVIRSVAVPRMAFLTLRNLGWLRRVNLVLASTPYAPSGCRWQRHKLHRRRELDCSVQCAI